MARADSNHTIKLSAITRDPFVRDTFLHAESDLGDDFGVLVETDLSLSETQSG